MPVGGRGALDLPHRISHRVVHEDVEMTVTLRRIVDRADVLVLIADIDLHAIRLAAFGADGRHDAVEQLLASPADDHDSLFLGETMRRRRPDPRAASRDESDLSLQTTCHIGIPI
jgi:hypothetical protein